MINTLTSAQTTLLHHYTIHFSIVSLWCFNVFEPGAFRLLSLDYWYWLVQGPLERVVRTPFRNRSPAAVN